MSIVTSHCKTYACFFAVQILSSGSDLSTHGFHFYPKLENLCLWSYFLLSKKRHAQTCQKVKSSIKHSLFIAGYFFFTEIQNLFRGRCKSNLEHTIRLHQQSSFSRNKVLRLSKRFRERVCGGLYNSCAHGTSDCDLIQKQGLC